MEFEWDPHKAESNLRKHRISFEDAIQVFLDPNRIETFDAREAYEKIAGKPWAWWNPPCWRSSTPFAGKTATLSD